MNEKGSALANTFSKLVNEREVLNTYWREAFQFSFPIRGQGFNHQADPLASASLAKTQQSMLYDSTASDSCRMLASSMIAGLTPTTQQWFSLSIPNIPDAQIPRSVRYWLQHSSETLHTMIHSSNYNAQAYEFFIDIAVGGMAGLYIEFDEQTGRMVFEEWALDGLYVMDTQGLGRIDTVFRRCMLTCSEAMAKFGAEALPHAMKEEQRRDPLSNKRYPFIHCIKPRILRNGKQSNGKLAKALPFESIYICEKSKTIVYEGGYHEFPVVIPRWMTIPGTEYALGPFNEALPDVKTLNKIVEMVLMNGEMAIAGTFVAKDDGVMNPHTTKIGPRRIIFAADTDNIKPLASGGNMQFATAEIQRLQFQIRRNLMSDQLEPTNQERTLSAEQVRTRTQLVRQFLGPVFSRLQAEFLNPLIERCFGLAFRAGALGQPPEELAQFAFVPDYKSPLAKAQRMDDVMSMDRFEASLFNTINVLQDKSLLDLYDLDTATQKRAEMLGIPVELVREQREVDQMRARRVQEQQAQQQAMAMAQAGQEPALAE